MRDYVNDVSTKVCGIEEPVQGYLTDKKTHPPRTLPQAYAWGPRGVLGGWASSYERGSPVQKCVE